MQEYFTRLPEALRRLITLISDTAQGEGVRVYLVGGFVRDLLMEVENLDLDIAVEGDGIAFARVLANELDASVLEHTRFGTATLTCSPQYKIDVASTRKELYPHPGSLPVVSPGTIEDDLFRRDFTINALAVSVNKESFGRLVDVFHGTRDLKEKKIRVLHDLSFIDDPTRILRAVRFEQRYGFSIERTTRTLLKDALVAKALQRLQPQRLRDELIVMLKEAYPVRQVSRLQALGAMGFIHERMHFCSRAKRLFTGVRRQIDWFRKEHRHRRHLDTWLMYFMALMDGLDRATVGAVCRRFVFRKGEEKRIMSFKKLSAGFLRRLCSPTTNVRGSFSALEGLSYETILLVKAKYRDRTLQSRLEHFLKVHDCLHCGISGHDLADMGIAPGPSYQKIFAKLRYAKLEGKIANKEEALAFARKVAAPLRKVSTQGCMHRV